MASSAKFRIDVAMHDLLMHEQTASASEVRTTCAAGATKSTVTRLDAGNRSGSKRRAPFTEWNSRAGQNNVIIRTDGTAAPCFPMYSSSFDWGNIDEPKFDQQQLGAVKKTCQRHCFSTLNHNLAYCYNDARVIKWVWANLVTNRLRGDKHPRSFED